MSAQAMRIPRSAVITGARRAPVPGAADPMLAWVAAGLLTIGLLMVASASMSIGERDAGNAFYYFQRQAVFALIGFTAAWIGTLVPMRLWEQGGLLWLGGALFLLVLVLVPGVGHEVNNAQRWIPLGAFSLQASEPARLMLLMYLAGYLVRHAEEVRHEFVAFLRPLAVLALAAGLLLMQPDFGAAVVLLVAALGMVWLAGVALRHFFAVGAVVTATMALLVWASPYRLRRLLGFRDPWADPFDSGFQLTNALIAVGRGEWFGVGLGGSVQKLFYLPEAHTDFLFAVFAEEFGSVGAVALVAAFLVLVWRALAIGRLSARAGRPYGAWLAFGIGIWLGFQAFVNIGVNLGVLPTKGLTLPLMSYGGSSLIVTCAAIGLLLRIAYEAQQASPVGSAR